MTQEKRLQSILHFLHKHGKIRLEQICDLFQVSRDSARRDLVKLEESGLVVRIRGGAILPTGSLNFTSYEERTENMESKRLIGRIAADLIADGETVLFDASSTIQMAAEELHASNVDIVTNSIDAADVLGKKDKVKVHLLGGEYHPWNRNVTGGQTIEAICRFHVQTLLLGACGIKNNGLSSPMVNEAYVKKEMIRHADRIIVLADHSKFQKSFLHHVCGFDEIDILITDKEPPQEIRELLMKHRVRTIIAEQQFNHNNHDKEIIP